MTLLQWVGLLVGLLVVVGIGYSVVAWWQNRDGGAS